MWVFASVRGIVDRALEFFWAVELDQNKTIPSGYFAAWQFEGEKEVRTVLERAAWVFTASRKSPESVF